MDPVQIPLSDTEPLVTSTVQQPVYLNPQSLPTSPVDDAHLPDPQPEVDIADHGAPQPAFVHPHESASIQEERAVEWIVPVQNGGPPERHPTVRERLKETLSVAKSEQAKYAEKAKWALWATNAAQFGQIIINALVTGLSAAPSNRKAQIGVSAMGALGTIVAAFLVRIRGTQEPERSTTHSQRLEKFIRELEAFILDEGFSTDRKWDKDIKHFRTQFDALQTAVHQSESGQPMSGP